MKVAKIKIGPYDYKIRVVPDLRDDGKKMWGLCDNHEKRIYLEKNMDRDTFRETLLHELVHAFEEVYDVNLGEKKVRMIGVGLSALFKDNPRLMRAL